MDVALLVTLTLVFSSQTSSAYTPYEYLLFVQQWGKSLCYVQTCSHYAPAVFTIHGLWPANYSGAHLTCSGLAFNERLMNQQKVLKANLAQHSWPNVINPADNMRFWTHEWDAHGKCSDTIFAQTAYFQWCHQMWENHPIGEILGRASKIPGPKQYTLSDIENAVKANTSHDPYVRCDKKNNKMLIEVVICFDYHGNNIVDCTLKSACNTSIILYPN